MSGMLISFNSSDPTELDSDGMTDFVHLTLETQKALQAYFTSIGAFPLQVPGTRF